MKTILTITLALLPMLATPEVVTGPVYVSCNSGRLTIRMPVPAREVTIAFSHAERACAPDA